MKALYSLANRIAGFDFFPWLVMQAQAGATEIVFDKSRISTKKWPIETVLRRFESILLPGCALVGLPYSIGTVGNPDLAPYHQRDFVRLCRQGVKFPRLRSVLPPGNARYTVTLRKTERSPTRNSKDENWLEFATEIGALVIPDYDEKPIGLHERMALYAGAEMNFFVTNGPCVLCFLSEYPAMQFDCANGAPVKAGVPMGERYPFLLPQHSMIYEPDDLPTIRKHFEQWKSQQSA